MATPPRVSGESSRARRPRFTLLATAVLLAAIIAIVLFILL
jgi:hypothetical protein